MLVQFTPYCQYRYCITVRKQRGVNIWIASRCSWQVGWSQLITKHRESTVRDFGPVFYFPCVAFSWDPLNVSPVSTQFTYQFYLWPTKFLQCYCQAASPVVLKVWSASLGGCICKITFIYGNHAALNIADIVQYSWYCANSVRVYWRNNTMFLNQGSASFA
jgi:hypothetical protein